MKKIIFLLVSIISSLLCLVNPFPVLADEILAIKSTKLPDTFTPPALAYEYLTQDQTRFRFMQSTQAIQGYITCSNVQLGDKQDIWRNCQNLLGNMSDILVSHVTPGTTTANNPSSNPIGLPSNVPAH